MTFEVVTRSYRHFGDDDKKTSSEKSNNLFVAIRYARGMQGIRIFFLVFPLCVLLELLMASSMQAVGTEYPMHISSYCAACGTDAERTPFFGKAGGSVAPGDGLFEKDSFFRACLMDQLLREFGDTQNAFKDAFLNSMVGHVLMILAFQMERSTSQNWSAGKLKAQNWWHLLGYVVLLSDCVLEYIFVLTLKRKDPSFIKTAGYTECDGTEVPEVLEETNILRSMGLTFAMIRSVSSGLVVLCYYMSHDAEELGFSDPGEDEENVEMGLLKAKPGGESGSESLGDQKVHPSEDL